MDEPLRMSGQPEANDDNTAVPFAIDDWLTAVPDRQILIIGTGGAESNYKRASVEFTPDNPTALPFDSDRFDLVVCNHLSARTGLTRESLKEIGRVMRPNGQLLIVDNLVPGSRLRGKKARQLRLAGEYVNAWMRLRNPQHKRFLSQDAWTQFLADCQWTVQQITTRETEQDFNTWSDYYSPTPNNRIRLQAMLLQAPEKVHGFLTPLESGDRIAFRTIEVFILATKRPV